MLLASCTETILPYFGKLFAYTINQLNAAYELIQGGGLTSLVIIVLITTNRRIFRSGGWTWNDTINLMHMIVMPI